MDAGCAINLLACGAAEEILEALPYDFAVSSLVLEREVLHLGGEGAEADGEEPAKESDPGVSGGATHAVPLQPLADGGFLRVLELESEGENATFVLLACELDDGEAETAAMAMHREGAVATDDRKAIRVLGRRASAVSIRRTSGLIREWAEKESVPAERVKRVLEAVQRLASFVPPGDDPDRDWWRRTVG